MEGFATADNIAKEMNKLLGTGRVPPDIFPSHRTGVDRYCQRNNVPYREDEKTGRGRGKITRRWQLSAIPGLPNSLREALGVDAVSEAAKVGSKSAQDWKEGIVLAAEEERIFREQCMEQFNALAEARQTSAKAKYELLRSCREFLTGGGFEGREKQGRKTWSTKGVESFVKALKEGRMPVESWIREELKREGETSLSYRSIISWRDAFEAEGLYGLADRYKSSMTTFLTKEHQEFIEACICDHPKINPQKLLQAMDARFSGEKIPSVWAINRYVKKWKNENASRYLYLTDPDAWRNKYMFAVGNASEDVVRLNQLWEADSTPGDIMLIDGRHTVIGVIDIWSRRVRFLVCPTSKAAWIAALIRSCLIEWGVPRGIKTDNGSDYTSGYLQAVLEALDIDHPLCRPFTPEEKPHIERALGTMSHGIVELLPGYIGHSVVDRKAIEARKSFAKRLMTRGEAVEVSLTSVQFQEILDRWTNAMYMHDRHKGLGDKTPAEMVHSWVEPIHKISNVRALDLLLLPAPEDGGMRTITKKGIRVTYGAAKLNYIALEFAGHEGESVLVKPDLTELGHAAIYLESREFLCWAEDPNWYGISKAEAANHLKAKQNNLIKEGTKELKAQARRLKTNDIYKEILEDRERKLRQEAVNITQLPKRTESYTTTALDEAARALDMLNPDPISSPLPPSREQIETKAQIMADLERRSATNVVELAQETARQRYKRWKGFKQQLENGELIPEQDYSFVASYGASSECQGFQMVEADLGIMTI